jgi:archaellum biogenesis ATPase FlaH
MQQPYPPLDEKHPRFLSLDGYGQYMLRIFYDILTGRSTDPADLALHHFLEKGWIRLFEILMYTLKEGGPNSFWAVYNYYCDSHPELLIWKNHFPPELLPQDDQLLRSSASLPGGCDVIGAFLDQVADAPLEWLWPGRIPLGAITIVEGDPSQGKSLFARDIAARVSSGQPMPDGSSGLAGGVILIDCEDSLSATIKPQLLQLGASSSRILAFSAVSYIQEGKKHERLFELNKDIEILSTLIERMQARLLVIDPLMAVLGGTDVYRDNFVRNTVFRLQRLVAQHNLACILVRHLSKVSSRNTLYRGGGSIAFTALARSMFLVHHHPQQADWRVLAHSKCNLAPLSPSLSFSIIPGETTSNIQWHGPCNYTAADLLYKNPIVQRKNGKNRQLITEILQHAYPETVTSQQFHERLPHMSRDNISTTLKRMSDANEIFQVSTGVFQALEPPDINLTSTGLTNLT